MTSKRKYRTGSNTQKELLALAAHKKTAVVVLGMHRAGTSVLAGVLGHLGCDLPESAMPRNAAHEEKRFDSRSIYQLNKEILTSAGSDWSDWQEFNPGWHRSAKAGEFLDRAQDILANEFGTSRLFVLKDPQICRYAPFWFDVLKAFDCQSAVICIHRNPADVAASLNRHDGLEPALGILIWLRYVLDAEASSRGMLRYFTSYDRFTRNWGQVAFDAQSVLGLAWPRMSAQVQTEVEDFLSGKAGHLTEDAQKVIKNPVLSKWVRDTYRILEKWAESGEDQEDYPLLDLIRTEFNSATPAFAQLVYRGMQSLRKADAAEAALKAATDELSRTGSALSEELQRADAAEAALKVASDDLSHTSSALAQRSLEAEQAAATLLEERERADAAEAALKAAADDLSHATSALAQRSLEAEQAAAALSEAHGQSEDLKRNIQTRFEELATLTKLMQASEQKHATAMAEMEQNLTELRAQKIQYENNYHAIRASTSWRITGPLRRIVRLLNFGSGQRKDGSQDDGPQDGF